MSNESVSVTDQEWKSTAQHLALAERELSAFFTAVHHLFGRERARSAADDWIEEFEQADWIGESREIVWRSVSIAAAARLFGRNNVERANHIKKQNLEYLE